MMLGLAVLLHVAVVAMAQGSSYEPQTVACPAEPLLMSTGNPLDQNQKLMEQESSFIQKREAMNERSWQDYLTKIDIGYDLAGVLVSKPRVGLSWSGGGIRAALFDAGVAKAFDGREDDNVAPLLQLASYASGTSAGAWFVSSMLANNMPQIHDLVLGASTPGAAPGWKLETSFLGGDDPKSVLASSYWSGILSKTRAKANAGFPVSLVDAWAQIMSLHFMNGTTANNILKKGPHDEATLFSAMRSQPVFNDSSMPYPIVTMGSSVANLSDISKRQSTGQLTVPPNNTAYEISPYYFGSYEMQLQSMIKTEYMGTSLKNGVPSGQCVTGFDNAGFIAGVSGNPFIRAVINLPGAYQSFTGMYASVLKSVSNYIAGMSSSPIQSNSFVANIVNPWYQYNPPNGKYDASTMPIIDGIDDGFSGEVIPFNPLLIRARAIDTIVTTDASGTNASDNFPNGDSVYATKDRVENYLGKGFAGFPPMPDTLEEFQNQKLNTHISFFGCNSSTGNVADVQNGFPLIVYIPNRPIPKVAPLTNTASYAMSSSLQDTPLVLDQSHRIAQMGLSDGEEPDASWPQCLGCALVERARQRSNLERSATCAQCFTQYCYS